MKKKHILLPIGIGIFLIMIYIEGPRKIFKTLIKGDLPFILLSELTLILVPLLKAFRLHKLISPLKKIRRASTFKIFFLGQLINQGFVSTLGDLSKPLMFQKFYKIKFSDALGAVVTGRIFDFSIIIFLASFAFFIISPNSSVKLALIIPLVLLLLILSIVLLPEKWFKKFEKLGKVYEIVRRFREYVKSLKLRYIITLIFISVLAWLIEGAGFALLFKSFNINLSYPIVLVITAISLLIGFISMVPGGIGSRETAMILLYSQFRVPGVVIMSLSLIYRFLVALNDLSGYTISQILE